MWFYNENYDVIIRTILLNYSGFPLPFSYWKVIFYLPMGYLFKEMILKSMKAL